MLGATIGAIGGIITFEGPIVSFMDHQGFTIGREVVLLPLVGTAALAIAVGLVAVTVSALMVSRAKLTEALSYE
jgi:hypothetical protein